MKNKLDSVMARLDRLYSGEDDCDGFWDANKYEQRAKLFEYVVRIYPDQELC